VPRGIVPELVRQHMDIPEYHLSQVGGAKVLKERAEKKAARGRRARGTSPPRSTWLLSAAEEDELELFYSVGDGERVRQA